MAGSFCGRKNLSDLAAGCQFFALEIKDISGSPMDEFKDILL